jgi:quinoprotein glucose dehydrogenase
MRIAALILLPIAPALYCQSDWPAYGHDPGGQRYSPLAQINAKNVTRLKPAWQYGVNPPGNPNSRAISGTEAVPIMAGGLLYSPTLQRTIVALDPETGKEVWKYELGPVGAPLRGVA